MVSSRSNTFCVSVFEQFQTFLALFLNAHKEGRRMPLNVNDVWKPTTVESGF